MRFSLVLLATVFLIIPAMAQEESSGMPESGSRSRNTVYDFSEVDISGKLKKPEGRSIIEPPEFKFKRLLDLDESFIPNIIRSVDDF